MLKIKVNDKSYKCVYLSVQTNCKTNKSLSLALKICVHNVKSDISTIPTYILINAKSCVETTIHPVFCCTLVSEMRPAVCKNIS